RGVVEGLPRVRVEHEQEDLVIARDLLAVLKVEVLDRVAARELRLEEREGLDALGMRGLADEDAVSLLHGELADQDGEVVLEVRLVERDRDRDRRPARVEEREAAVDLARLGGVARADGARDLRDLLALGLGFEPRVAPGIDHLHAHVAAGGLDVVEQVEERALRAFFLWRQVAREVAADREAAL